MATIRVCGVQMHVASSKKDNLPRILDYIRQGDCDFMVFPEMSLTGYHGKFDEDRTREAWKQIAAACRQSYVTAIIGTGAHIEGHAYIQSRIYSDEGHLLGTHEKIVPTESDRSWCRPGEGLRIFEHNDTLFGCLICNDLWVTPGCGPYPDPRLTYLLSKKGAQLIFHSIHSGNSQIHTAYHESNLALRAREGNLYIITANAAVESGAVNAASGVMSPEGEWLVQCPREGEHKFTYDIDMD
ncbi:MAG: carbon-nitrogen hydrolase family protein [Candidatus Hydrogenedentes bacterium]|nr:carbon-nitrogen hydrolase family protein [Candidatus Hydrogenedentota bacterium]